MPPPLFFLIPQHAVITPIVCIPHRASFGLKWVRGIHAELLGRKLRLTQAWLLWFTDDAGDDGVACVLSQQPERYRKMILTADPSCSGTFR